MSETGTDEAAPAAIAAAHVLPPPPPASSGNASAGLKTGIAVPGTRSGMGLADVFGAENRRRILETREAPWRMVCALIGWRAGQGVVLGTGALISPQLVLTAGHNLVRIFEHIEVVPGLDVETRPFGSRIVKPDAFRRHPDWARLGEPERDAGALILDRPFDGIDGWFAIAAPADDALKNWNANIAGYPKVSPEDGSDKGNQMWSHANHIKEAGARVIRYTIDTTVGQSGAPVWVQDEAAATPTIIGIHAYGVPNNIMGPTASNSATRIDDDLAGHIRDWAADSTR